MAISNTSKTQKLFLSNRSADITNMGLSEVSSLEKIKLNVSVKNFIKVNSITFSKVIKKLKFINFLKIDIEGHEYKIFPSIIKNINKIDKIFCEMHGENGRKDFVKEYKKWDKKLFKFQKNKFFYW